MKIRLTKEHWKNLGYLLILLALAPIAIEFLILAEFVGLEFAFTFMLVYFRNLFEELVIKWWRLKADIAAVFDNLLNLLMFQPRAAGISASVSCFIIIFTGSTLVACAIWLPALAMSVGHL